MIKKKSNLKFDQLYKKIANWSKIMKKITDFLYNKYFLLDLLQLSMLL